MRTIILVLLIMCITTTVRAEESKVDKYLKEAQERESLSRTYMCYDNEIVLLLRAQYFLDLARFEYEREKDKKCDEQ